MRGYVVYFDDVLGEGLVKSEGGQTLFLHYSSLPGYSRHSRVSVKEFAPLEFEIVDGFKGPQAHNIRYIEGESRVSVCENILLKILEQPDDDDRFGKDWRLNNWISNLKECAQREGHLIYGEFWGR